MSILQLKREIQQYEKSSPRVRAPVARPTAMMAHVRYRPMASLLTAEEVAELLQVNRSWVYNAARQDAIPHVRFGRYVRFRKQSIDAWLSERERKV